MLTLNKSWTHLLVEVLAGSYARPGMARLVNLGGALCVDVPASVFGVANPLSAGARYDVAINGATAVATFAAGGARTVGQFGLAVSSTGKAKASTSHYGVEVDAEAKQLGWKAGRKVTISVQGNTVLVFT